MKRIMGMVMTFVMVMTMMLTGCGGSTEETAAEAKPAATEEAAKSGDDKITIGVTFDYLSDAMSYCVDGVNGYAAENSNVEVIVQDAEFDVAKQLQQVENFIASGVDAVLIKPIDADGCGPISDACKEAGIPLVFTNSPGNCDYDSYIGSDHVYSGEVEAQILADALGGEGKVAILMGELMNEAAGMRTDGNKSIFDQYEGIEVVSEQEASWMRDLAMEKTENWLNSGLEIDGIIANNDEMALGAAIACQEAGRDDILIAGIDASVDALEALKAGTMVGTVFQNMYQQGFQGVETCVKIVNGETVPKYVDVPYEKVLPEQADEYLSKY